MNGVITTRDLVIHPVLIIGGFSVRAYFRCWERIARGVGTVTFLECVAGSIHGA